MAAAIDSYSDLGSDIEEIDELTDVFNAAAKHLELLIASKKIDNELILRLYGLYKVSVSGKCNVPRPSWYEVKAKQKWEAWHMLDDLSKQEAQQQYIDLIKKLDPKWDGHQSPNTDTKSESWVTVSSMVNTDDVINDNEKTIFDFVKEGNASQVQTLIRKVNVNEIDENGLGLIHWACDRGNADILDILLQNGGNVNLQAEDGQTALHYAASCGHSNCVEILLKYGVDISIKDEDALTAAEIATDSSISDLIKNFKTTTL